MPEVKDYDGKKAKKTQSKRRPHHEMEAAEGGEALNTEALNEGVAAAAGEESPEDLNPDLSADSLSAEEASTQPGAFSSDSEPPHEEEKVRLEFYGSDILRAKAPKAMELADIVADEWVKDGQFHGLPVGSPAAQVAASMALRKAKDVEKKLEEKGIISMAKMGLQFVKSKIEKKGE